MEILCLPCPLPGLDIVEVSIGLTLLGGDDGIGARLGDVTLLAEAAPFRRLERLLALLAGDDMLVLNNDSCSSQSTTLK